MTHSWPGNVRELRNVVERHVLGLDRPVGAKAGVVQAPSGTAQSLGEQLDAFERCVLEQELAKHKGSAQAAATALGLPVRTLNDRMRRHGLSRKAYL
jgi:two-component system C4-dicarboxylate transport response regulator DctD